jgi:SAM-dependent methyltransferase
MGPVFGRIQCFGSLNMRPRITLAHFLIRLGKLIESLAIVVMRPADLIEFSRQSYARPHMLGIWGSEERMAQGLRPEETALLDVLPLKEGRLLLLGVGGGREAIPLAQQGFAVTGVDFVPGLVEKAMENAAQRGLKIEGLVQEVSELDVPANSYDVAWLATTMYSYVPTQQRRVEMLRRIGKALRAGGYLVCGFRWDVRSGFSPKGLWARKAVAYLTLGNLWYEPGDKLSGGIEFVHAFSSEEELRSEFEAGGFEVLYVHIPRGLSGGAVLEKRGAYLLNH